MDKRKIKKFVISHRKLFCFFTKIYNTLSFKNKLQPNGCKVSIGLNIIEGLKIFSNGHNNTVIIEDFAKIKKSTITLNGDNNTVIIKKSSFLSKVEIYTEDSGNEITIGPHTRMFGDVHFAAIEGTKITIGENCLFSSDIYFRTGDSHSVVNMDGYRINFSKDILIDDHVWIGTKVTCLKGVHVSKDSVVAATTTLCKNYDTPNVVIAGVPGKIIKTDINWMNERLKVVSQSDLC